MNGECREGLSPFVFIDLIEKKSYGRESGGFGDTLAWRLPDIAKISECKGERVEIF